MSRAFTLIEILIVVSVIGILAAVAMPNFLEAQNRAKLARVRADHRTLATALEAYFVDQHAYPSGESNGTVKWLRWMTTPQAYLADAQVPDPFVGRDADPANLATFVSYPYHRYYVFNEMGYLNAFSATGQLFSPYGTPGELKVKFYVLFSHGPDGVRSKGSNGATFTQSANLFDPAHFTEFIYDPTNGVTSNGEILRLGGEPVGRAEASMRLIQKTSGQ